VDVIDVQVDKAKDAVTVNAGVLAPEIYRACWGADPPTPVQEPHCTVRVRVGELVEGKDVWWRCDQPGIDNEMTEALRAYVLPFLERMHATRALEDFLADSNVTRQRYPPPVIYLALLRKERGDLPGACAILRDLHDHAGGSWKARVGQLIEAIRCP
jgi:hypothetical protein